MGSALPLPTRGLAPDPVQLLKAELGRGSPHTAGLAALRAAGGGCGRAGADHASEARGGQGSVCLLVTL